MTTCCDVLPDIGEKIPTAKLTLARGDSWQALITCALQSDGTPLDLTGQGVSASVMKDLGDVVIFAPTVDLTDPTHGKFMLSISVEQSSLLTAGVYQNDSAGQYWLLVRMATTDGQQSTLFRALIQCIPGVPL